MGIDFKKLMSKVISNVFDNDLMTIKRTVKEVNTDGSTGETALTEIYTDVPCDVQFYREDIPDTNTTSGKQTVMYLKLYCSTDVDLKSNDYVIIRKKSGDTFTEYSGYVSCPEVKSSRLCTIIEEYKYG